MTADIKSDIRSLTLKELTADILEMGMQKYRAAQIYSWLHQKQIFSFDEMTNIGKADKEKLSSRYSLPPIHIRDIQISKIDGTRKYLFELPDGNMIESVYIKYHHGNSVCISSQAGCRMGCRFCASTINGLARSLTAGEMLAQVYAIGKHTLSRVSNVVMMGSGEPLDNYGQLVRFIRMLSDENGICISQRNITVSTCGLVPQMYALADECLTVTLAVSLHAPNDEIRKTMMPIAGKYSISQILEAAEYYYKKTKRRLTFEYSLVKGVNDSAKEALQLCALLKGINCLVNLIPINPVKERNFSQSESKNILEFKKLLEKNGINVTIRREMGRDIDGACGQLRKRFIDQN